MALNLTVVTVQRPPFVFQNTYANGTGGLQWYGMLIELLPLLFQYAQINVTLNYYQTPLDAGGVLVNGSWNGVIGELVAGRADIAAFPLSLAPGRPDAIDMTYSYYEAGIGMIVKKQSAEKGVTVFLKPFTIQLWLSLAATVTFMTLGLQLLAWVSPYGRYEVKKIRNAANDAAAVEKFVIESENSSFLLDSLMAAVLNPPLPAGKSWAVRLPSVAYYLFMVVVVASFTANLASYLTVQSFKTVVTNLQDLRRKNLPFVVNSGGATYNYFANSMDPSTLLMRSKMQLIVGNPAALAMVRSGQSAAYLTDTPTLLYFAGEAPCDLEVVGPEFGPGVYTFGLQKNSSLTHILNTSMLQLGLSGVLDSLHKKWITDLDVCSSNNGISNGSLNVEEFAGLWYLLLAVMGFGFLWAMGERLLVLLVAKFPRLRGKMDAAQNILAPHGKRFNLSRRFSMAPGRRTADVEMPQKDVEMADNGGVSPRYPRGARHQNGNRTLSAIDEAVRKVDEETETEYEQTPNVASAFVKVIASDMEPRC